MGRIFETRKATMFKRYAKMAKQFTKIGREIEIDEYEKNKLIREKYEVSIESYTLKINALLDKLKKYNELQKGNDFTFRRGSGRLGKGHQELYFTRRSGCWDQEKPAKASVFLPLQIRPWHKMR